jgi:hypothetical protein
VNKRFLLIIAGNLLSGVLLAGCTEKHERSTDNSKESEQVATAAATAQSVTGDVPGEASPADGFELIRHESLGQLRLELPADEVLELLGEPEARSKPAVWAADGEVHQEWRYPAKGISLGMTGEGNGRHISAITVTEPCRLKTDRGIHIGSTREQVLEAYGKETDRSVENSETVVAGSVYGGIIFRFRNNRASEIFIGAAAE